jgi:hypothetical protein
VKQVAVLTEAAADIEAGSRRSWSMSPEREVAVRLLEGMEESLATD